MIDVAQSNFDLGGLVDADLDTFVIALYVKIDDAFGMDPALRPWRPAVGIAPRLSDSELNRPGFPGGSKPWKGWSHGTTAPRIEAVPA